MRYWYHPESESLWTTPGSEVDHEDAMLGVEEIDEETYKQKTAERSEVVRGTYAER